MRRGSEREEQRTSSLRMGGAFGNIMVILYKIQTSSGWFKESLKRNFPRPVWTL